MIRLACSPKRHGSLVLNGLRLECSRMIGENTPNCTHRVASSSSLLPKKCPPMSWLHQPKPTLDAVAVKYGWKSSDAQLITVSPEKPIGYRWLPTPA